MPLIPVRDIRIYYQISGQGPRLLYIGGTGGDLRASPSVFESPLAEHFQILAYDQRGLGRSDRPDRPYSMAAYADDAAGLLDALGWEDCLVMGFSFGGMVALELVLRHERRVRRLALTGAGAGGRLGASFPLHELVDLPLEQKARRMVELADVRMDAQGRKEHPAQFRAALEAAMARLSVGAGEPGRRTGAFRQLEARREHDVHDRLHRIKAPTLIAAGRHDGIAPPEIQRNLAEAIPGAELELFDGGHMFFLQNPRAFPRIIAFLKNDEA